VVSSCAFHLTARPDDFHSATSYLDLHQVAWNPQVEIAEICPSAVRSRRCVVYGLLTPDASLLGVALSLPYVPCGIPSKSPVNNPRHSEIAGSQLPRNWLLPADTMRL